MHKTILAIALLGLTACVSETEEDVKVHVEETEKRDGLDGTHNRVSAQFLGTNLAAK